MTIYGCYLLALLPVLAAFLLWVFDKYFVWWEALVLAASGFIISTIFYYCVSSSMYYDTETWSGQVSNAIHIPSWTEYYEYEVDRTIYVTVKDYDAKGRCIGSHQESRQVFDHWEPTTEYHSDSWQCSDTLIGSSYIDASRFEDIKQKFGGGLNAVAGERSNFLHHNSHMLSGDPNDYVTVNSTNYVYPVTTTKTWTNRVKACPSVFSYEKVPDDIKVYDYPINSDHFVSSRIFGPAGVTVLKWDQMNAILGPTKKVNVILINFGDGDSGLGQYQEAKWIGGKKNDLVITYGGPNQKPTWCYVFGWTESNLAKLNIQTIILNNGMSDKTIPLIQEEIKKNYIIKNWHKFDYLQAEIPFSMYIWLVIIILVVGGGWIAYALNNDINKDTNPGGTDEEGQKIQRTRRSSYRNSWE